MATANTLPHDVLMEIAEQLSERLIIAEDDTASFSFRSLQELGNPLNSNLELGETFELWRLSFAAVQRSYGSTLTALAKRAGWHHQVRLDGVSVAFARSSESKKENNRSVQEIFVSPLAQEIDKAIAWADKYIPDDKLALLLSVPAYQIEALWFVESDRRAETASNSSIYIVSSPSESDRLQPSQLISDEDFLEALRNENPSMGIIA